MNFIIEVVVADRFHCNDNSRFVGLGYLGIILRMRPASASERRRYIVASSLIEWAHT